MNALFTVLTILVLIASVLITLIVLLQNGKGGGLASNFVAGNQTFGVRQTADFLEKTTWGLAIALVVLCIMATAFISGNSSEDGSMVQESLEQTLPTEGQPAFPVLPQENTEAQPQN